MATTKQAVADICGGLSDSVGQVSASEVKSANLAGFLLPLGAGELGRNVLVRCAEGSVQSYWLVRFAQMLLAYDGIEEADRVVGRIQNLPDLSPVYLAQTATIMHSVGRITQAETVLNSLSDASAQLDFMSLAAVARAGAKIGLPDITRDVAGRMMTVMAENHTQQLLETLQFALITLPGETGKELVTQFLNTHFSDPEEPKTNLVVGVLRHLSEDEATGTRMIQEALDRLPQDYFSQGWAGNILMRARFDDEADRCLQASLADGPLAFMHQEFLANIYFSAGHWQKASDIFERAISVVPYVKSVLMRKLYCDLPEEFKSAEVFSNAAGLCMAFQQNQDHYSDIVPSHKPRTRLTVAG